MRYLLFLILIPATLFAESVMLRQLNNGTIEQKTEAIYHLGYARNKKPFWLYIKYLNFSPQENDELPAIRCREAAADALGRIKDKRAGKYLVERWKVEKQATVKRKIIYALRRYKDKEIANIIREGIKEKEERLVFESILSAAYFDDSSLAADVKAFLDSTKVDTLKIACAFSLVMLNNNADDNAKFLRLSLTDKNPEVRYWCAFFIGEANRTEAIEDIKRAIEIEHRYYVARELDMTLTKLRFSLRTQREIREYNEYEKVIK